MQTCRHDDHSKFIASATSVLLCRDLVYGFAQVVLRKSSDKAAIEKVVNDTIVEFANRGYRSLGVAIADGDSVRICFQQHLLLVQSKTKWW